MKITRSLVLKLIILLIIVLGGFAIKKSYFKSQSDTFKTTKVERGTIEQVVSTSGKIKAKKEVELKFQISGKLAWVGVREGDRVLAGQIIARLDQAELQKKFRKNLVGLC